MSDIDHEDVEGGMDMFAEPDDFRPKTPPPQVIVVPYDFTGQGSTMTLLPASDDQGKDADHLRIHLLGSHPLWGHHLWNACLDISRYLQQHAGTLLKGKSVLELGAAAGVPSLVCAREGAAVVVATDYPDEPLLEVLRANVSENLRGDHGGRIVAEGYLWGSDTSQIKTYLPSGSTGFDVLLLSDLIFNHQAHPALLATMSTCLAQERASPSVDCSHPSQQAAQLYEHDESQPGFPDDLLVGNFTESPPSGPCVLVFFTHHRPHLAAKDIDFFVKAAEQGWQVERVGRWTREVIAIALDQVLSA